MPEIPDEIKNLANVLRLKFTPPDFVPGCEVQDVTDKDEFTTNNGWIEAYVGQHNQQRIRYYGEPAGIAVGDFVDVEYFPAYRLYRVFSATLGGTASPGGIRTDRLWESDFGSVAMQTDASGNIGIGTATPGEAVDVAAALTGAAGSHEDEPVIRLTQTADTSYDIGDVHSGIEFYSEDPQGAFPGIQAYIRSVTTRADGITSADAGLVFGVSASGAAGVDSVIIQGDGNVGIGTTTPGEKLDIAAALTGAAGSHAGEPVVRLTQTADTSYNIGDVHGGIEFYSEDTQGLFPDVQAYIRAVTTRADGITAADAGLVFGVSASGTVGADSVIIQGDGGFGIGTTVVPVGGVGAAKLAIDGTEGSETAGPHIQITTDEDDYPAFQQLNFRHDNVSLNFDAYYDGAWKSGDAGSNFQLLKSSDKFWLRYDSGVAQGSTATWNTGLMLNTDGNIGIGLSTPTGRIHTYDSISGFLLWEYDALDATVRTVLPNDAFDVLHIAHFDYLMVNAGAFVSSSGSAIPTGTIPVVVGGATITISVAADGSVTIARTAGVLATDVALTVRWI